MRVNKNYWIPKQKYQLVVWLSKRFPAETKNFKRMSKEMLYAIYFSTRDKIERATKSIHDSVSDQIERAVQP